MFDFPSPATDGQTVTGPNGQLYVYHAANGVWGASGSASPLAIAYGGTGATTAPAALTALGAVAKAGDTMTGGLTVSLNASGSLPAVSAGSVPLRMAGANATQVIVNLDSYGTGGGSQYMTRFARGTAAAPTAVQNNDPLGSIVFEGYNGSGYNNSVSISAGATENFTTGNAGGGLYFYTTTNGGTAGAVRMQLGQGMMVNNSSGAAPPGGDLGPGTINMPGALTVNLNTAAPPTLGPGNLLRAFAANGVNPSISCATFNGTAAFRTQTAAGTGASPTATINGYGLGSYAFSGYSGSAYRDGAFIYATTTEAWGVSNGGANLTFWTTPNGTTSAATSLTLAGNTATFSGTVSAVGSLTANASGNLSTLFLNGAHNWYIQSDSTQSFFIVDASASAYRITIDNTGACKNTTGTWTTISDTHAKVNIEDYTPGLDAILTLQPIRYDLDMDDWQGEGIVGFRAEEVAKVLPELCGTATHKLNGKDTELQTLAPTGVVFALVNACKELASQNKALAAKIEALEKRANGAAKKR